MLILPMLNEAWISMKSNKLRSFLTILGIIIGVVAVVLMVAVGQTVRNEIGKELESLGGNRLIIVPSSIKRNGILTNTRPTLTYSDVLAIKKLKDVKLATGGVIVQAMTSYNGVNWQASIHGVSVDTFEIENIQLKEGTFFDDNDVDNANNYAVIGYKVAENLFDTNEEALGTVIRIGSIPYTVIGVAKEKGGSITGEDSDNAIYIPLFSLKRKLIRSKFADSVNYISVVSENEQSLKYVQNRVRNLLAGRHFANDDEEDFEILNLKDVADRINKIGIILSVLLASIASISLFVGSIGIMNMMLVSVTERTREIGIRKAIGADKYDILMQFLFEAILISLVGSLIGMLLGIGFSQVGGAIFDKDVPISYLTVVISIIIALVVGVVSGIMPAIKATKLDPIEALRYQ